MGAHFEAVDEGISWRPWIPGTLKLDSILSLFKCVSLFPDQGRICVVFFPFQIVHDRLGFEFESSSIFLGFEVRRTMRSNILVRGHPERTSQVRGEGGSAQRAQSKATFIVTMTS